MRIKFKHVSRKHDGAIETSRVFRDLFLMDASDKKSIVCLFFRPAYDQAYVFSIFGFDAICLSSTF